MAETIIQKVESMDTIYKIFHDLVKQMALWANLADKYHAEGKNEECELAAWHAGFFSNALDYLQEHTEKVFGEDLVDFAHSEMGIELLKDVREIRGYAE